MDRQRVCYLLSCAGATIAMTGCAATQTAEMPASVRQIHQAEASTVFERAEACLEGFGYRIAERDPQNGVLVTEPVLGGGEGESRRRLTEWRGPTSLRSIAEVGVVDTEEPDTVKVYCKVLVQELVTGAHRMYHRDRSLCDAPTDSPIDREAGTSDAQNAVWQTVRRDKLREREILEAILTSMELETAQEMPPNP